MKALLIKCRCVNLSTAAKPPKPVLLKSSNKVAMKAVKPASERRRRKENEDTPVRVLKGCVCDVAVMS